jgi:hypothetical protein
MNFDRANTQLGNIELTFPASTIRSIECIVRDSEFERWSDELRLAEIEGSSWLLLGSSQVRSVLDILPHLSPHGIQSIFPAFLVECYLLEGDVDLSWQVAHFIRTSKANLSQIPTHQILCLAESVNLLSEICSSRGMVLESRHYARAFQILSAISKDPCSNGLL